MKLNDKNIELEEKERSKTLVERFYLKTGLIPYVKDNNGNLSLLSVIIDNVELSAILNLDKMVYYTKFDDKIIKIERFQSLKELNDLLLKNLTENQIVNDLAFSYEYYVSGGDIRDQDKLIYSEFVDALYNGKQKQIESVL